MILLKSSSERIGSFYQNVRSSGKKSIIGFCYRAEPWDTFTWDKFVCSLMLTRLLVIINYQLCVIKVGALGCQYWEWLGIGLYNIHTHNNSPLHSHSIAKLFYKIIFCISNLSVILHNPAIVGLQENWESTLPPPSL